MSEPSIIQGGIAEDDRGYIRFVNDFDMSAVKRFYIISNSDLELVRGWRGHRIEQRWFYVLSGSFNMDVLRIDNWNSASHELAIERKVIKAEEMQIVYIPNGYATAFQALEVESKLLVFADYDIEHAVNDDYTWVTDYFVNRK